MLGAECPYRSNEHRIIKGSPVMKYIKRFAPKDVRDKLFFYYHTIAKTWVIGIWTRPGYFQDMYNFEGRRVPSHEEMKKVLNRFTPYSGPSMADKYREAEYRRLRRDTDVQKIEAEKLRMRGSTKTSIIL
jgi:hypothetical protein